MFSYFTEGINCIFLWSLIFAVYIISFLWVTFVSFWFSCLFWWRLVILQFSSVAQLCLTLCDPMNCSTPGLPVHHQLPEFTQTHLHWVSDAIQPSHPQLSPSPPAPNLSQHQSHSQHVSQLFTWGSQSTGVSASASFPPKKSQGWSPSEWTG